MKFNFQLFNRKNITRAKVNRALDENMYEYLAKGFWIDESIIDEKLYLEHLEVIKLYYDRYSKFIVLHNASSIAFTWLAIAYWWKMSWTIYIIFVALPFISSLANAYHMNKKVNITFNTLLKKTKESATISESSKT
jgi:hypothetical protein